MTSSNDVSQAPINIKVVQAEAMLILTEGKGVLESMDQLNEWDSITEVLHNIKELVSFITKLILAVEIVVKRTNAELKGIKSGEKLDVACQILDDLITFPWYLEALDGPLFKIAISTLVDTINRVHGNDWDLDAAEEAIAKGTDFLKYVPGALPAEA